jgi:ribonuclease HI
MPASGGNEETGKAVVSDWKRMRFRKNKVWMAVDSHGNPVTKNERVLIKYQLEQPHEYWANRGGVTELQATENDRTENGEAAAHASSKAIETKDVIKIYTDGASSGNPGPSGIGVYLKYGTQCKEISDYIGIATNNVAELKAIEAALAAVKAKRRPVRIFTDSEYAYGLLALNWKARKNRDLVEQIRRQMGRFSDLKLIKVRGHAGDEGNERADSLATSAIRQAAADG